MRTAAGAGRARLMKQLVTENLLLSVAGGACGIGLAVVGTRLYPLLVPGDFPALLRHVTIDARVLTFALAISVLSSVVFGLLPALRASPAGPKRSAQGRGANRRCWPAAREHRAAGDRDPLSMVLLVGAGLMLRGLAEERRLPGFDPKRLLTADILRGGPGFQQDTARHEPRDSAGRGVLRPAPRARAGLAGRHQGRHHQPSADGRVDALLHLLDRPAQKGSRMMADFAEVDAQAFETLGVRVLNGRGIESRTWPPHHGWPSSTRPSPIATSPERTPSGRQSASRSDGGGQPGPMEEPQPRQIVGVVADVGYPGYFAQAPDVIYVPFRQHLREYGSEDQWLHTRGAPRPNGGRPAESGSIGRPGGRGRRQGPDCPQLLDHGGPGRAVAVGDERPFSDLPLRRVRHVGGPARDGRRLRRHVVDRRPEGHGDGHPHGPGRPARPGRAHAAGPVAPARRSRSCSASSAASRWGRC